MLEIKIMNTYERKIRLVKSPQAMKRQPAYKEYRSDFSESIISPIYLKYI